MNNPFTTGPDNALYRVAVKHTDNVWRYSARPPVPFSLLEVELGVFANHMLPNERLYVIRGFTDVDFEHGLQLLNSGDLEKLEAAWTRSETPPIPPTPKPAKHRNLPAKTGQEQRTSRQDMLWHLLEQSQEPTKDERYLFKLPLDPKEFKVWQELYQKYQEGDFAWEFDGNDPRNK